MWTMEARLAAYEERITKMAEDMEAVQRENTKLRRRFAESNDTALSTHSEREDNEEQDNFEVNRERREKKGIHDELKELAEKCGEMEKKNGGPSSFLYSERIMVVPFQPKFKVL